MKIEYRSALVYVHGALAGALKETDDGYSFKYDKEYLLNKNNPPVSLTLPLKEEEYTSKWLFPFFDGLIPEGWLLNEIVNKFNLDINNRFAILLVSCKDPIGAVTIRSVHE